MFREFFKLPEHRILLLILFIGLVHGLIYVFVVPPWQHYDEPGHFEYAWIKALHPGESVENNIDQDLRDRVLASMVESNFFYKIYGSPATDPAFQPTWVFIPQFNDPPLYHLIVGIPVRLFPNLDVLTLMYLMRLISTGFLLISIWAAWGAVRELAPPGHILRWMVPLFMALLPGFVDLMTAINNDTAAIAYMSLFFWFSLRLIRRRMNVFDILILIIITTISFFTKENIWTALIFLPVVIFLSVFPVKFRHWAWVLIAFAIVLVSFALFTWGDAAHWYRMTPQTELTRVDKKSSSASPSTALQIELIPGEVSSRSLWQHLPVNSMQNITGKSVTIGGWVWASHPTRIATPGLMFFQVTGRSALMHQVIDVGSTPIFVSTIVDIPENAYRVLVVLSPQIEPVDDPTTIYYTGLFLGDDTCPHIDTPQFSDLSGSEGVWCEKQITNLIRNGNGYQSGPAIRSTVYQLAQRISSDTEMSLVSMFGYLTDLKGSNWYNLTAAKTLFKTFWASFGWGQVHLADPWVYRVLAVITLLLIMGAGVFLIRNWVWWVADTSDLLFFSVLFCITGWIIAFLAGMYFGGLLLRVVYPVARYAFPVIVPTSFLLCAGWIEWFNWPKKQNERFHFIAGILFVTFLVLLDAYALYSLAQYYYWS